MRIKIKKQDVVFSKLVRERANYRCRNCGVDKRQEPATLDCAHIMGRRSVALRWHPVNAVSLCRRCHIFFTEHPFDWRDFCVTLFGEELVAELRYVANQSVKWTEAVREDIYQHYKQQLKIMEAKRAKGSKKILDFKPYEIMHEFGTVQV